MAKPTAPVRVGFVGTGYIADWHAQALRLVPGVTLAAVCDKDEARAGAFARQHGVARVFGTLEAMLADAESALDAVHVLLPPDLHAQAAGLIIDAGRHALLEKPMALTGAECTGLVDRARANGVKLGVGHNFLFAPPYERLRGDLAAGRLGRPDLVTINWHRPLGQLQAGPFDQWMLRDPRHILLEIGPHLAAFMVDLVGPQPLVSARASNPVTLPGGRVFYRRWLVDAGGDRTQVVLSLSFAPGYSEFAVQVRGALASATVDLERNTYLLRRHTRYGMDYDAYRMTIGEAAALKSQARGTFGRYVLSKLKLSKQGSAYAWSIGQALRAFYAGSPDQLDRRISGTLGAEVVGFCQAVGDAAGVVSAQAPQAGAAPASAAPGAVAGPPARPDVLVLGATGFIGRELTLRLLERGRVVRVLARNPGKLADELRDARVQVLAGDLARPDDRARALEGIRQVHHLARPTTVKLWPEYVEHDIEITRQLAEACLAGGVERLVYTGTIDSYYAGVKAGTITEATPLDPNIRRRNYYARAKAAAEVLLLGLHRTRKLPVVIVRPGIVIGRGGSPFHWGVGMWSWNAVCQVWGEGRNPLPLVLVEDVADGLIAAADTPGIEGESFNLIADTDLTARDYLDALGEATGSAFQVLPTPPWRFYAADLAKWVVKVLVRHPDRLRRPSYRDWESRTQRARFDSSKARRVLGWRPVDDRAELIRRGIALPAAEVLG
jgi:nucleoside-diphosphate-sugar epimerase/predicted dehydrogenase